MSSTSRNTFTTPRNKLGRISGTTCKDKESPIPKNARQVPCLFNAFQLHTLSYNDIYQGSSTYFY